MSILAHRDGELIYCPQTERAVACDSCGEHVFWLNEQVTCPRGCQDVEGREEPDPWLLQEQAWSDIDQEVA